MNVIILALIGGITVVLTTAFLVVGHIASSAIQRDKR